MEVKVYGKNEIENIDLIKLETISKRLKLQSHAVLTNSLNRENNVIHFIVWKNT